MLTASELAGELERILRLTRRLMPPLAQKPHLFHESKAELIEAVAALIERQRGAPPASPRAFTAPAMDSGVRFVRNGGREIPVERRGQRSALLT
jgi:hypothetical protein